MTSQVAITGNTYPVKESLKAMGARWNGDAKAWMVPSEKADEARKLVAGGSTSVAPSKTYRPTRCRECHREAGRYNRILRNGMCGECYRDYREDQEQG
jgi:hypothetical protein